MKIKTLILGSLSILFIAACQQNSNDQQQETKNDQEVTREETSTRSETKNPSENNTSPISENKEKTNKKEETTKSAAVVDEPIHLNKAMFIERIMDYEKNRENWVFKGDKPCIIDFYADWCKPCKIVSPILDELAKEYAGQIIVYKVDTEKERALAADFGIRNIPTFIFCPKEGNPVSFSGIGQTPEETKEIFRKQIETVLLK